MCGGKFNPGVTSLTSTELHQGWIWSGMADFSLEQTFIAELYFSQKYKRNTDRSVAVLV